MAESAVIEDDSADDLDSVGGSGSEEEKPADSLAITTPEPHSSTHSGFVTLPASQSEEFVATQGVAPLPVAATTPIRTHPPVHRTASFDHRWIESPVPQGKKVLCKIVRHKEGIERLYPSYELFIEEPDESLTFLLAARKRKKSKSSNYYITTSRITASKVKENVVAKVRSNFLGTEFTIFDDGRNPSPKRDNRIHPENKPIRAELASVLYEHNILGFKGPRKVKVLLPGMNKSGDRIVIRPENPSQTLVDRHRTQDPDVLVLHNKSPQWNEETQSYVLNFGGRVLLASVKNFQIVSEHDLDYVLLQFGRVSDDAFTLDFQYPLSCALAFAIALTSFDSKIACE